MKHYFVPRKQDSLVFVFLRIMILSHYESKLKKLQMQFTNNTEMFFYLIFKYYQRIDELINQKSSSKKKYQEVTKNYQNIGIRVSPAIHQLLKDLSDQTGYSISAIVRFLIEWECIESQTQNSVPSQSFSEMHQSATFSEIVITRIEIYHWHYIFEEFVAEDLRWGFS